MAVVLGENSYGKSAVRLVKVDRGADRHDITDLTLDIAFEGEYRAVHLEGDNASCLPTDTMKNTVYALAGQHPVNPPEAFALTLVRHFLQTSQHIRSARIRVQSHGWQRMSVRGQGHHHAFVRGSGERRIAAVAGTREGASVEAGIEGLEILKSTGSAFAGYLRDQYTTLPETTDRIMATAVTARWRYVAEADYEACFGRVRTALLETFAEHDESASVQHTLFAMGRAALEACPEAADIRLSLPNRHHLLVDLARFGLRNENEVFVPTSEPYGLIEATVVREES